MSRVLSIFCDESGDFGNLSSYYILSLVFHNQSVSISEPISHLNHFLSNNLVGEQNVIHTYPIIRREGKYRNLDYAKRIKTFNAIVAFFRHCNIKAKTLVVDKKSTKNKSHIYKSLNKQLKNFINTNFVAFAKYNKIIIYYDRGQKEISKMLLDEFSSNFKNVDFRTINPKDYYLFQVADLVCTLELLQLKYPDLSKTEMKFFKSLNNLKKRYLKILKNKRID